MRRLFNIFAIMSLILCVVMALLWIRSHWQMDEWIVNFSASKTTLYTQPGILAVVWETNTRHVYYVYDWWMIVIFSAAPIAWLSYLVHRSFNRNPENICPTCGYDLRASPGRCPECGREP